MFALSRRKDTHIIRPPRGDRGCSNDRPEGTQAQSKRHKTRQEFRYDFPVSTFGKAAL